MSIGTDLILSTKVKGASSSSKEIKSVSDSVKGLSNDAQALLKVFGVAGASAAIISFGKSALKAAIDFEQTQVAFRTMIGDAKIADSVLRELANFASKTPFTLKGIEQNSKQLLAMGIDLNNLIPTLKFLGDVSSGLNVPLERLALNFGQVKTQGKLTGRELRDFSVAGVPLIDQLAKQLNISKSEIQDMVSKGKIGFKDVEDAFIGMTSEGGKFFDLMDKQSNTLGGLISNLEDAYDIFLRGAGSDYLEFSKDVVRSLIDFTQNTLPKIADEVSLFARNIFEILDEAANGIGETWTFFMNLFNSTTSTGLNNDLKSWQSFFRTVLLGIKTLETGLKILGEIVTSPITGFEAASAKLREEIDKNAELTDKFNLNIFERAQIGGRSSLRVVGSFFEGISSSIDPIKDKTEELIDFWAKLQVSSDSLAKNTGQSWSELQKKIGSTVNDITSSTSVLSDSTKKAAIETTKNLIDISKKYYDSRESIKGTLEKLNEDHAKNLTEVNKKISDTKEEISKLKKEYDKLQKEQSGDFAQKIIDQQTKIADIQKSIDEEKLKDNTDLKSLNLLKQRLADEERSLIEAQDFINQLKITDKDFALQLENDITEAKRRARQTELENYIEDFKIKRKTALNDFNFNNDLLNNKLSNLELELEEEQKVYEESYIKIKNKMTFLNAHFENILKKNTDITKIETEKQIEFFKRLTESAERAANAMNIGGVSKIGNSGIQARATGGNVNSGQQYLVGEAGPELFTPAISGNITPNNKLGGITINFSGVFGKDAAEEIGDMILEKFQKSIAF